MKIFNGPVVNLKPRGMKPYEIKAKSDEAEVWLYDVIGDSWEGTTGKQFADELKAAGDIKTLNIYINSPGGSVFDGVAIHNVLKRHKAKKIVQVDGIAASIASVIAMAGDEIRIASNGMMMIHDPWAMTMGTADEFRRMADSLDKVRDAILTSYVERTTSTEDQLSEWMTAETWFTAEEAVEAGLADVVGDEVAIAAFANHDLSKFKHVPKPLAKAVEAEDSADDGEEHTTKPHSAVVTSEGEHSVASPYKERVARMSLIAQKKGSKIAR